MRLKGAPLQGIKDAQGCQKAISASRLNLHLCLGNVTSFKKHNSATTNSQP